MCRPLAEDSHPFLAAGSSGGEVGCSGAVAFLWRGMASLRGRAIVQPSAVSGSGSALESLGAGTADLLRLAAAGRVESASHPLL